MHGRAVILVALAACGGGGGKATTPVGNAGGTAGAVPAPLYAALFADGSTFRYDVATRRSMWDDTDPKADANGNVVEESTAVMTCHVRGVTRLADAVAATLDCDEPGSGVPVADAGPSGTYVATRAGLWRTEAVPDDAAVAALDPTQMMLAAEPVARTATEEPEAGFGSKIEVTQGADGSWCWSSSSWGGDEGGSTLCFAGGTLVGGSAFFAGGSSVDMTFQLVK